MRRNTERLSRTFFDLAGDGAILSPCRRYRYVLTRLVSNMPTKRVVFIMVNPSTANARKDDPTIRRCMLMALSLDASQLIVVNLFAARSTDVKRLARMRDPYGPENDRWLKEAFGAGDVVIVAWGSRRKLPVRLRGVGDRLRIMAHRFRKPLHCFGTTRDGDPRHPLYLPRSARLERWVA